MSDASMPSRSEIIQAMSWYEDMERGCWGIEYATRVLEAHEAAVVAEYLRVRRPPCWCGEGDAPWNDHNQCCPVFITEGDLR